MAIVADSITEYCKKSGEKHGEERGEKLGRECSNLHGKIDLLQEQFEDGVINPGYFEAKTASLRAKLEELE